MLLIDRCCRKSLFWRPNEFGDRTNCPPLGPSRIIWRLLCAYATWRREATGRQGSSVCCGSGANGRDRRFAQRGSNPRKLIPLVPRQSYFARVLAPLVPRPVSEPLFRAIRSRPASMSNRRHRPEFHQNTKNERTSSSRSRTVSLVVGGGSSLEIDH